MMTQEPANPVRKTAAKAARASVSLIWLVPILALIVTLGVAWNAYSDRGALIKVRFEDATGITPGQTAVKFREVTVGQVEAVHFTPDLRQVIADLRIDNSVAPYIDADAEFWIVRPQVSAQGISRLDTVLTGAFIEGNWDTEKGPRPDDGIYKALARAPLSRPGEKGTWITLAAENAKGFAEGGPVMYRGVQLGRMENLRLSENGDRVLTDIFVPAPHDARLTTQTVFWDTSGFSLSLGAQGLSFDVQSLASLVQGGVEFATLESGGEPVANGHIYTLYKDEASARANLFVSENNDLRLTMRVETSLKGLSHGADVRFQGLRVGRVTDLSMQVDDTGPTPRSYQQITLQLSPQRLGLSQDADADDALDYLTRRVQDGLRARVASAGVLGTALMVELVDLPNAAPAQMDVSAQPYPVIPSGPADLSDFTASAQGFLSRIGKLPLEETLNAATEMMQAVTGFVASPDMREIPQGLREAIDRTGEAMTEVRGVAGDLRDSGAMANAGKMVDAATSAADSIREAMAEAPEMVDRIKEAAQDMKEFGFDEIGDQAEGILTDLRAMLGTKDAEALPRNLSNTLESASALMDDLRQGGATQSLNQMLDSGRLAADEIAAAAQRMPQLATRLEALADAAGSTISAYGSRSQVNAEMMNTLRELRRAASSFGALARMIERNPRAFILGR